MANLTRLLVLLCVNVWSVLSSYSDLKAVCNKKVVKGGYGYYEYQGSCNQYLHCNLEGDANIETCAVGTFYDGHRCRHSSDVACPYDPCSMKPSGFKYPDMQTCFGFYKCKKGHSVYGKCQKNTYFNPSHQGCFPDPTCNQPYGLHPCSAGTTHPFPGHLNMFYLFDGKSSMTPMKCPNGLWYDPKICSCDWIHPGISSQDCNPMFYFPYDGHFLEKYNRVTQAPNNAVTIYRKAAYFAPGGRIMVWMMNDIDMNSDFAFCFEFMAKTYNGEIAIISNDYKTSQFTYKLTYIPSMRKLRAQLMLKDGKTAELIILGVNPQSPHFVRFARIGSMLKLRVDNTPAAILNTPTGVATSNRPLVVGEAFGCNGFVGFFDEFKFFKCVPKNFFADHSKK